MLLRNQREMRCVYLGKWPHGDYMAGEHVELKLCRDPGKELVITETDVELGQGMECGNRVVYHFVMPDRDVHIDYEYRQIYLRCAACGNEYEHGENVCPHCNALLHEFAGEIKDCNDITNDGVLAWGVIVGRFVFEVYGKVVYALTDTPHVGPSDVTVCYQISREVYDRLLAMSRSHAIPEPPVPAALFNEYFKLFLCSESAYAKRNEFTLRDVDLSLCEDA